MSNLQNYCQNVGRSGGTLNNNQLPYQTRERVDAWVSQGRQGRQGR